MMTDEERVAELRKPLNPKDIKPAPRGKFGDYIDGYHAISEANRIFGEDGWSYRITRLEKVSDQTVSLPGKNGPYDQYRVGYLCTVLVEALSIHKEGSAVGAGLGNPNDIAAHHESAVKEAETDALKRALRSYGNTFGLALYDKDRAHVGVEESPPEKPERTTNNPTTPSEVKEVGDWAIEALELKRMISGSTQLGYLENLNTTERFREFRQSASTGLIEQVRDAFSEKKATFENAKAA